jgi:hypothetical protein
MRWVVESSLATGSKQHCSQVDGKTAEAQTAKAAGCLTEKCRLLGQPHHSSPFHSVESMHDVIPVEYGQEVLHGLRRVELAPILPKDAPGVLNGTQQRLLVGGIHGQRNSIEPQFKPAATESFPNAPDS